MSKQDKVKSHSLIRGASKKKTPIEERISSLLRPNSDLELNDSDEDHYYLDYLSDEEIREKFTIMMKEMNIANDTVTMNTPVEKMRIMLENNYKVNKKDKMLTGTIKKKSPNKDRIINLQRPNSDLDQSEMEEHKHYLDSLGDEEIREEFMNMMKEMNIANDTVMMNTPVEKMRIMLENNYKMSRIHHKLDSPKEYIEHLRREDLSPKEIAKTLETLQEALRTNKITWLQEFAHTGLNALLSILNKCYNGGTINRQWNRVQLEVIKCLKVICNNTSGIKEFFRQPEAFTFLATSLNPSKPNIMIEVLRLMSIFCLPVWQQDKMDGHKEVLNAITIVGELKKQDRFTPIIVGLKIQDNDLLRLNCLSMVNSLINFVPEDNLIFRLHLRNEFMRTGLYDLLETLESSEHVDIKKQLEVFNKSKLEDMKEWKNRFMVCVEEMDNLDRCFEVLKNQVQDTNCEAPMLSILQHLAFIRDDSRNNYYKLIEECVSQIVLHHNGCDPDFRATKRFEISVDYIIEQLNTKDEKVKSEHESRLEDALTKIQKLEAELAVAKSQVGEVVCNGGEIP